MIVTKRHTFFRRLFINVACNKFVALISNGTLNEIYTVEHV